MANQEDFQIVSEGGGAYTVSVPSLDDVTTFTLLIADAPQVSGGRLADDVSTARATVALLLTHQDAADLPGQVELTDVAAAYPTAVEDIITLRG